MYGSMMLVLEEEEKARKQIEKGGKR